MTRACLLLLIVSGVAGAAAPTALTLDQAIDLALKNNRAITIASAHTDEMKSASKVAASDYYPQVSSSASYLHFTETSVLQFAQGSFGQFPGLGSLPGSQLIVKQGALDHYIVRNQAAQPLTQLLRVREGHRAAIAAEVSAIANLDDTRKQIALKVRQIYYGLIAAGLDRKVAQEQIRLVAEQLQEVRQDVMRGVVLEVALTDSQTKLLQAKQEDLSARLRQRDLFARFNELVGLPPGTEISVDTRAPAPLDVPGYDECIRLAEAAAPEIAEAEQAIKKAAAAVRASKYEYVPDLTLFARHDYQNGVAFLFHNYGVVGAQFSFKVFDGGKRRAQIAERQAQYRQAVENLARLREAAAANAQIALDKVEQSASLMALARQLAELRAESLGIAKVQLANDALVPSKVTETQVALSKAQSDLIKTQLAVVQAQAELQVAIGRMPR